MKFTQVALAAFLVIVSVDAVALPKPDAIAEAAETVPKPVASEKDYEVGHKWCLPIYGGDGCSNKDKGGDDPNPPKVHPWCWLPGEACFKAKRQLEVLENAFMKL